MMIKHSIPLLFFVIHVSYQQQSQSFESSIKLTVLGTRFQPRNPIELLATLSNVRSILPCAMRCNQNRQCRTFDYDSSSLVCRLFEGDISTGTVLNNSIPASSRIGSIYSNTPDALEQYSLYNKSCNQCGLGVNRYLQCSNNTCQCPINTYWNGRTCSNRLYNGSSCNSSSMCRQDLNLICSNGMTTCMVDSPRGEASHFPQLIEHCVKRMRISSVTSLLYNHALEDWQHSSILIHALFQIFRIHLLEDGMRGATIHR